VGGLEWGGVLLLDKFTSLPVIFGIRGSELFLVDPGIVGRSVFGEIGDLKDIGIISSLFIS
jgi:hypothetical protein